MSARIAQLKRGIARLIDAYSEGLLDKEEFGPKIRHAKEPLARLQAEETQWADAESQRAELRLVIGKLEEFAEHMDQVSGASRLVHPSGDHSSTRKADRGQRRPDPHRVSGYHRPFC